MKYFATILHATAVAANVSELKTSITAEGVTLPQAAVVCQKYLETNLNLVYRDPALFYALLMVTEDKSQDVRILAATQNLLSSRATRAESLQQSLDAFKEAYEQCLKNKVEYITAANLKTQPCFVAAEYFEYANATQSVIEKSVIEIRKLLASLKATSISTSALPLSYLDLRDKFKAQAEKTIEVHATKVINVQYSILGAVKDLLTLSEAMIVANVKQVTATKRLKNIASELKMTASTRVLNEEAIQDINVLVGAASMLSSGDILNLAQTVVKRFKDKMKPVRRVTDTMTTTPTTTSTTSTTTTTTPTTTSTTSTTSTTTTTTPTKISNILKGNSWANAVKSANEYLTSHPDLLAKDHALHSMLKLLVNAKTEAIGLKLVEAVTSLLEQRDAPISHLFADKECLSSTKTVSRDNKESQPCVAIVEKAIAADEQGQHASSFIFGQVGGFRKVIDKLSQRKSDFQKEYGELKKLYQHSNRFAMATYELIAKLRDMIFVTGAMIVSEVSAVETSDISKPLMRHIGKLLTNALFDGMDVGGITDLTGNCDDLEPTDLLHLVTGAVKNVIAWAPDYETASKLEESSSSWSTERPSVEEANTTENSTTTDRTTASTISTDQIGEETSTTISPVTEVSTSTETAVILKDDSGNHIVAVTVIIIVFIFLLVLLSLFIVCRRSKPNASASVV